jgi:hypothetical protein
MLADLLERLAESGTGENKLKLLRDHVKRHPKASVKASVDDLVDLLNKEGWKLTAQKLELLATEPVPPPAPK